LMLRRGFGFSGSMIVGLFLTTISYAFLFKFRS
jgi:hypothetical protein